MLAECPSQEMCFRCKSPPLGGIRRPVDVEGTAQAYPGNRYVKLSLSANDFRRPTITARMGISQQLSVVLRWCNSVNRFDGLVRLLNEGVT